MEQKRERIVVLRITEEEHALLKDAAARDHRTLSTYGRIHLIAQALRDVGVKQ